MVINLASGHKLTDPENKISGKSVQGCWTLGRAGVIITGVAAMSRASYIAHYEFTNTGGITVALDRV